jgi:hypothetical protein
VLGGARVLRAVAVFVATLVAVEWWLRSRGGADATVEV